MSAAAAHGGSGGRPPHDNRRNKPGRDHEKSSSSEIDEDALAAARALIKRSRDKKKAAASEGPSRQEAADLRKQRGAIRDSPCLQCVRSALSQVRGHCHSTALSGVPRCYECTLNNRTCEPIPPAMEAPARFLFRAMCQPAENRSEADLHMFRQAIRALIQLDSLGSTHRVNNPAGDNRTGSLEPLTPPDVVAMMERRRKSRQEGGGNQSDSQPSSAQQQPASRPSQPAARSQQPVSRPPSLQQLPSRPASVASSAQNSSQPVSRSSSLQEIAPPAASNAPATPRGRGRPRGSRGGSTRQPASQSGPQVEQESPSRGRGSRGRGGRRGGGRGG